MFSSPFPLINRTNSLLQEYIEKEMIKQDQAVNSNLEPRPLEDGMVL